MPDVRIPVYELHIRPMFRLLDREHMQKVVGAFDLWDINAVWQYRNQISAKMKLDMPGTRYGGPFPQEWIDVFDRWITTASDTEVGHHLVLAAPQSDYKIQSLGGDKRRLSVNVMTPTQKCRVWFDLESVGPAERNYTLYLEPAYPKELPAPTPMTANEGFAKESATRLVITDANGTKEVNIPLR